MNKKRPAAASLLFIFLLAFTAVITGCLFISAVFYTGAVDTASFAEKIDIVRRPLSGIAAAMILFPVLSSALYLLLFRAFRKPALPPDTSAVSPSRRLTVFTAAAALAALAAGVFWIKTNPYPPIADQYVLWDSAVGLTQGQLLPEYADYLRCYPYQKGMVLFFSFGVRLFGTHPLHFIRPLNVLCFALILCLLTYIARRLSRSEEAACLCALAVLFFSPLLLYTVYVYATLLCLALVLLSFAALLFLTEQADAGRFPAGIPACLTVVPVSIACVLYGSAWIAVIAEALYLIWLFIKYRGAKPSPSFRASFGIILALFLLPALLNRGTQKLFTAVTGLEETAGTPASAFLVMGMSSENGANGPGSHNGYDIALYSENNLDDEKTAAAASAALREILGEYRDGERKISFFYEKTLYQWTDPWFSSASLTLHPKTVPVTASARFERLMNSGFFDRLQDFLAAYQLFIYAAALCAVVLFLIKATARAKGKPVPGGVSDGTVLLLLYFCGGFVFQLFWESKSRYCMPYYTVLFPLAASGILLAASQIARPDGSYYNKESAVSRKKT